MGRFIDLTGKMFGRLSVIQAAGKTRSGSYQWLCQCNCSSARVTLVTSGNLRSGHTRSCGCLGQEINGRRLVKDLTGKRFGRLVALQPAGRSKQLRVLWLCRCECGKMHVVDSSSLNEGKSRSCGCLNREQIRARFTKHALTRHLHARGLTLHQVASTAKVSPSFLSSVAAGRTRPRRSYGMIKAYVWGELTPDGRRSRVVRCSCCGELFFRSQSHRVRGAKRQFKDRSHRERWLRGERAPVAQSQGDIPQTMMRSKKQRRRNPETLAIEALIFQQKLQLMRCKNDPNPS